MKNDDTYLENICSRPVLTSFSFSKVNILAAEKFNLTAFFISAIEQHQGFGKLLFNFF